MRWSDAALILACAAAAAWRPVETLVYSYAVLGPAHYLTQISWLERRGFAAADPRDGRIMALLVLPLAAVGMRPDSPWWGASVAYCVSAAFVPSRPAKFLLAAAGAVVAALLAARGWTLWALLLPSLIHVYLFTAMFLLTGAKRERTAPAATAAFLHLAVGALLVFAGRGPAPMPEALRSGVGFFLPVAGALQARLGREGWEGTSAVLAFMGFAYLYHYLNWFTKAGFLGWHRMERGRAVWLTLAYAAALSLYARSFETGFLASAWLGLAHVLLELPLDARALLGLTRRPSDPMLP